MDEGRDFSDGCRQSGSGFLEFLVEFRKLCVSIVDIIAEGGDGSIVGVLVALNHRFLYEQVGGEGGNTRAMFCDSGFERDETPFMVVDVRTKVANFVIEDIIFGQEALTMN